LDRSATGTGHYEARSIRQAVDGLLVNRAEVWVVVARRDDDPFELLLGAGGESDPPLKVCRGVIDGDTLVIGDADPDQDHFLSDLMETDTCGHA